MRRGKNVPNRHFIILDFSNLVGPRVTTGARYRLKADIAFSSLPSCYVALLLCKERNKYL